MPSAPLPADEPVTAAWLDATLRSAGVLPAGSVLGFTTRTGEAHNSKVERVALRYSETAPPDAPRAVLLKRMSKGWGELEVAFYERAASQLGGGLVPECVDHAFDTTTGASHLLLVDVSDAYVPLVERTELLDNDAVPPPATLELVMQVLARFHAAFWEHPSLGAEDPFHLRPWFSDDRAFSELVERREREWSEAVVIAGDALAGVAPHFARALEELPAVWASGLSARVAQRRHLTLVHGDCYLTQWLRRRIGSGVLLTDFDSVSAGPPAFDLVFLLPTFWTREQRVANEGRALHSYHDALVEAGVSGYGWNDLLADYTSMLSLMVFDVIFDIANGSSARYWEPKLACLVAAHTDWSEGAPPWVTKF